MNIQKNLLGISILLFAILLSICSSGMELICLAIGSIGLVLSIVGLSSKSK